MYNLHEMGNIFIHGNDDAVSKTTKEQLKKLLESKEFEISEEFSDASDLIIAIGGDGNFLRALKLAGYPSTPILGINTGHLGFFTEFLPTELEEVAEICVHKNYTLQKHKTIKTEIETKQGILTLDPAVNDVFIKHGHSSMIHLNLYIGEEFTEAFSGDGIIISSSAGSTAYNYSLGGSLVDPRLNLLQVTPVAPQNNAVYRSITSSLLIPSDEKINIVPEDQDNVVIVVDGNESIMPNAAKISVSISDKTVQIVRKQNYSFWNKVRSKFL